LSKGLLDLKRFQLFLRFFVELNWCVLMLSY